MDIVPDEAEGGAVDLRDEPDTAPAPQDDPPPVLRAAVAPLRERVVDIVQEGLHGLKDVGWAHLGDFLTESETGHALRQWFGEHPALDRPYDQGRLLRAIDRDIAEIDAMMRKQVDACLHHPRMQQLESAWRGVAFLVNQSDGMDGVKIRTLNLSWAELCRDLDRAIEFVEKYDGAYVIIQLMLRQPGIAVMPMIGDPTAVRVNLVPRDYIVDAISYLSARAESAGQARESVTRMCEELIANPLIEDYEVRVSERAGAGAT